MTAVRRVVTGLDPAGRSAIVADDAVPHSQPGVGLAWASRQVPADNQAASPPVADWWEIMNGGGTTFLVVRFPPGGAAPLHATDTIDYITMLAGEITIVTETGEAVLRPGDLCVDRGIVHGWRNDGAVDAVYAVVTVPALPVGAGRTAAPFA